MSKRGFSFYDIEVFLREAGAERINDGALTSFDRELQNELKELIDEAKIYANYAGRNKVIKSSDVGLIGIKRRKKFIISKKEVRRKSTKKISSIHRIVARL